MRSFTMSMMVGLAMVTAATTGSAGEPVVQARPKIELAPPVRITAFRRPTGWLPAYTGGSVPVVIDIDNSGNAQVDDVVVKLDIGEKVLEKTVSIGGRKRMELVFEDTEGLASSCAAKQYSIKLAMPGVAESTRTGSIQPTCTFTSSIEEGWNLKSPDLVNAEKSSTAYLSRPVLVSGPTCSAGPTVKVRLVNRSGYASPSVIVHARDLDSTPQIRSQTWAAFPIAAGEEKDLQLSPVGGVTPDVPERMVLGIVDWTKSLKGRTSGGGLAIVTKRSCQLAYDLR